MRAAPSGAGRLSCLTRCPRGPASRCCADTPRSSSAPGHGGCDDRTPDRGTMSSVRMLGPAGYPANRAAGRWVFDVLLTLLAWASAVLYYATAAHHPPSAGKIV